MWYPGQAWLWLKSKRDIQAELGSGSGGIGISELSSGQTRTLSRPQWSSLPLPGLVVSFPEWLGCMLQRHLWAEFQICLSPCKLSGNKKNLIKGAPCSQIELLVRLKASFFKILLWFRENRNIRKKRKKIHVNMCIVWFSVFIWSHKIRCSLLRQNYCPYQKPMTTWPIFFVVCIYTAQMGLFMIPYITRNIVYHLGKQFN